MAARFGWLVSYPKSGNTWVRTLLASLLSGGGPVDINAMDGSAGICTYAEMDELLCIESSELSADEIAEARPHLHATIAANTDGGLLLRKVHDRFWKTSSGIPVFPADTSQGAIYIVRDPRDIAVSYSHHLGISIDDIIDHMANEDAVLGQSSPRGKEQLVQPIGCWSGHLRSWLDQADIRTLTVRYEDMLENPARQLAAMANHLGIEVTPSVIEAAVAAARFDVLQGQERTHGFNERYVRANAPFFRAGVSGGWRARLSSAQAMRLSQAHGEMMARFDYR